jgi:hypothetical protein
MHCLTDRTYVKLQPSPPWPEMLHRMLLRLDHQWARKWGIYSPNPVSQWDEKFICKHLLNTWTIRHSPKKLVNAFCHLRSKNSTRRVGEMVKRTGFSSRDPGSIHMAPQTHPISIFKFRINFYTIYSGQFSLPHLL